jgi:hypothetical protein
MSQINPFTNSILSTPQAQQTRALEKDQQLRKSREKIRNTALDEDTDEQHVESAEEVQPINRHDEHERNFKRSRHKGKHDHDDNHDGDENPHLDLTA